MRVLLLTPPMVAFNAPYAATPLLTAFLRREGVQTHQADLALGTALRLFSKAGLSSLLDDLRKRRGPRSDSVREFLRQADRYLDTVDEVVGALQSEGPLPFWTWRWETTLPRGPRFRVLEEMRQTGGDPRAAAGGSWSRYLASLYLDDLADVIRTGVDARFGLSWYGDRSLLLNSPWKRIRQAVEDARDTWVDRALQGALRDVLDRIGPDLVGVTIPFAGTVHGAMRIAELVKAWRRGTPLVVGGGWVNTEWRDLDDPSVFDLFDYVTYDDGEQPLLQVVRHVQGGCSSNDLVRTRIRVRGRVQWKDAAPRPLRHRDRPAPCYDGLDLRRYCRVAESVNPMARLWTERCWARFALAHGCYWRRCVFCDTTLDYIARYDPADPETIVGWMNDVQEQTGLKSFHFVDEAAPPKLLRQVADLILQRGMNVQWWVNIRFERSFTPSLARHLAQAGCIAVTGGLECAEAQGLRRLRKGIELPSAVRSMAALAGQGIWIHAYLMYGVPGETFQDTVDALELVRQLFVEGLLLSGYWHRFALTLHSPLFREWRRHGIRRVERPKGFSCNELRFVAPGTARSDWLGRSLEKALYNYMLGVGWEEPVGVWFGRRLPSPRLAPDAVGRWIRSSRSLRAFERGHLPRTKASDPGRAS